MLIIGLAVLIFLALVYVALPLWAKIIVLVINSFFPDPIPVLDEVLMFAGIIRDILKIDKAMTIVEWMRAHKALALCIAVGVLIIFVGLIVVVLQNV